MRLHHLLLPLLAAAACLPDTDLTDEGAEPPPEAPALGVLLDPAPGSAEVPRNLGSVLVALADPMAATSLRLESGGSAAGLGAPEPARCPEAEATCFRIPLAAPLGALATYELRPPGKGGASLGAFVTGAELDLDAPQVSGLAVAEAGACLRLTLTSSEPATVTAVATAGGARIESAAGTGATAIDAPIPLAGLPSDQEGTLTVRLEDRAGNRVELPPVAIHTPVAAAPLVITEVLANAAGTEPAQEFVEILNAGAAPVAVGDFVFEDATGRDLLPAATLAPGARALIVPSTFSATPDKDVPPAPGTELLRVDTRLGGDGLGNAGEAVRLRDPAGNLVSSYGGFVNVSASAWSGKSVQRSAPGACDHPLSWNAKPLAATPGS